MPRTGGNETSKFIVLDPCMRVLEFIWHKIALKLLFQPQLYTDQISHYAVVHSTLINFEYVIILLRTKAHVNSIENFVFFNVSDVI